MPSPSAVVVYPGGSIRYAFAANRHCKSPRHTITVLVSAAPPLVAPHNRRVGCTDERDRIYWKSALSVDCCLLWSVLSSFMLLLPVEFACFWFLWRSDGREPVFASESSSSAERRSATGHTHTRRERSSAYLSSSPISEIAIPWPRSQPKRQKLPTPQENQWFSTPAVKTTFLRTRKYVRTKLIDHTSDT